MVLWRLERTRDKALSILLSPRLPKHLGSASGLVTFHHGTVHTPHTMGQSTPPPWDSPRPPTLLVLLLFPSPGGGHSPRPPPPSSTEAALRPGGSQWQLSGFLT